MTGTIEHAAKRPGYFFILGDDGIKYFAHRHQVKDKKNYTEFCYTGNRVTFEPGEQKSMEGHPQANEIVLEKINKFERYIRNKNNERIEELRDELYEMLEKKSREQITDGSSEAFCAGVQSGLTDAAAYVYNYFNEMIIK